MTQKPNQSLAATRLRLALRFDVLDNKTEILLQPMISDDHLDEPTLLLSLGPMGEQAPDLISEGNKPQFSTRENVDDQVVIFTPSYEIPNQDSESKVPAPNHLKFQETKPLAEALIWQQKKIMENASSAGLQLTPLPMTPTISRQILRPVLPAIPPPTALPEFAQAPKNTRNNASSKPGSPTAKPKPVSPWRRASTAPANDFPKRTPSSKEELSSNALMAAASVAYAARGEKISTKGTGANSMHDNPRRMKPGSIKNSKRNIRKAIYAAPYPPNEMTFKKIGPRRSQRRRSPAIAYFTAFERTTLLIVFMMLSLFVGVRQIGPQQNKPSPVGQVQSADSARVGASSKIRHIEARLGSIHE